MSGPWHQTGRARVSERSPQAHAVCDSCGFIFNLVDLRTQFQWAGTKLQNLNLLKCKQCLDVPSIQLKTIVLPPDPIPVLNPRPEQYAVTVPSFIATESETFIGSDLTTEDGNNLIWEIEVTPNPDPNDPALYPE